MNLQTYKDRFLKTHKDMINDISVIRETDIRQRASELKPGETLLPGSLNGFYFETNLKTAKDKLSDYSKKQYDLISEIENEIKDFMTGTPSEETARALQSMKLIENPTKDYVNNMLEKYGDNYTAYQVINDYARKNDFVLDKSSNIQEMENANTLIQNLKSEVFKSYDVSAVNNLTPGYNAFIEFAINNLS